MSLVSGLDDSTIRPLKRVFSNLVAVVVVVVVASATSTETPLGLDRLVIASLDLGQLVVHIQIGCLG